ncbi:MAG: hypothetical protein WCK91_02325 [bacterium]
MQEAKRKFKVIGTKVESPGVTTLRLYYTSGEVPRYRAGQFITVYMSDSTTSQGKAYSLSRIFIDSSFEITIRAIGEFSNYLCSLVVGDHVIASDPYGFFYSESSDTPLVMIAAGVGVTPYRAMIYESIEKREVRPMYLIYSSRTEEDIIFKKELDALAKNNKNLNVLHFLTRQDKLGNGMNRGRIDPDKTLKKIKEVNIAEFLICGSIAFVRDMRNGLRASGVGDEYIYTEAFFSH